MNEKIFEKLEQLYTEINNCEEIKKLLELKNKIYNDTDLKEKLEKCKNSVNKYDSYYVAVKKEIIDNPLIKEYRELENELYFIVLEMNRKLNSLINKKGCSNESN